MALYKQNNSIEVFGAKEIEDLFKTLPGMINRDGVWKHFFREVSKPVVKKAKEKADAISNESPTGTGQLGKSIGYFTTKASRKYNGGYVGPRVKGRFAKKSQTYKGKNKKKIYGVSGFYGAWVEYGSEVKFGGKGYGRKSQPFMRPAFDETKVEMMNNALKDAEKVVAKQIKRHERKLQKHGYFGY
tara:strand:- start:627 stop:1184 length:558 start_codon:yes stop_codon:yes gene_type:complete